MPITEQQFRAREKELQQERRTHRPVNESLLRQASVHASLLTGHPAWDKYQQTLQVDINNAESELSTIYDKLATPLTSDQLGLVYVNLNMVRERLRVLTYCMKLPKDIIEHAGEVLDKSSE